MHLVLNLLRKAGHRSILQVPATGAGVIKDDDYIYVLTNIRNDYSTKQVAEIPETMSLGSLDE